MTEYSRGWIDALDVAAESVDCGGTSVCNVPKCDDGSCIRSLSGDCQRDEAIFIRSLRPEPPDA